MRSRVKYHFLRLLLSAIFIGLLSAGMIWLLKNGTEQVEHLLMPVARNNVWVSVLFPITGLSIIYILRIYLFKKRENKGIKEVVDVLKTRNPQLPVYKIPSHIINGFLTIIFGGSTGIEVSSVVASAAIGSAVNNQGSILKKYRSELICAGVAAAITALFNSPLAGIFFAYEVMYKKLTRSFVFLTSLATIVVYAFNFFLHEKPLFEVTVNTWHTYAIPYFILLGIIAGFNSVYLTKMVIFLKKRFARFPQKYTGVWVGALTIGLIIYFFPELYGEGYHAMGHMLETANEMDFTMTILWSLVPVLLLKPIITSLTLASGGDGGVFAPSLFIGAFLGLVMALILNNFFHAGVIPMNFMIVGMASVLCSSIHAPLTAIFLVCGITGNYVLLIPLAIGCAISRITAQLTYPYTVYSYRPK